MRWRGGQLEKHREQVVGSGGGGRCINIQRSAKVDAQGCVNAAGKLRPK